MKQNEIDYLNKLFAVSSDLSDQAEVAVPEVEVPEGLSERLKAIDESKPAPVITETVSVAKKRKVLSFPQVASIAASLFVAIMGFQFYQQQQTIKQLEQAQADLATALEYIGEANRIAGTQVLNSLNENMKKAGVEPAMQIGRDALRDSLSPNPTDPEPKTQTKTHSL